MDEQHILHVRLAERQPQLLSVLGVTAQYRNLAPVQPGADDQSIETVTFYVTT